MPNRVNNDYFENIAAAEKAMGIKAQHVIEPAPEEIERDHHHIAIAWRGGVIWLDMSDLKDHFCVDVRQFVPGGGSFEPDLAGQGVFGMVNGWRSTLSGDPLLDPDGTPVLGHGWNGSYVVTLMHDKEPSENQTNRPAGPGRG